MSGRVIASCGHTLSEAEGLGVSITYPLDEYEILSGGYCHACAEALKDVAMTPEEVELFMATGVVERRKIIKNRC